LRFETWRDFPDFAAVFPRKSRENPATKKITAGKSVLFSAEKSEAGGVLTTFSSANKKKSFQKGRQNRPRPWLNPRQAVGAGRSGLFFFFFFYSVGLTMASTSHTKKKKFFGAGFGRP